MWSQEDLSRLLDECRCVDWHGRVVLVNWPLENNQTRSIVYLMARNRTVSMTRHTETIEVITRDQRRRRWSLAEKAALVQVK